MAICLRCHKKSTLFHPLNLNADGLCPECVEIVRAEHEAEAKRRREEAARQRAAYEARMEQHRREEAAERDALARQRIEQIEQQRLADLKKPFQAPDTMSGYVLTHSYPDVGIYVPDALMAAAKAIPPHKQLTLFFDPDNQHDSDAIGVKYNEQLIGYLYKNKLRDWVAETDADNDQCVLPVSVYWDTKPVLGLYFYRSAASYAQQMKNRDGFKKYTLGGNSGEEMQFNISSCTAGEQVYIEYDPDRERYVAMVDGHEIGLFPFSAEDYLASYTDFEARILDITERENRKQVVSIMIAPNK